MSEEPKPKIEKTSNINEPELTITASITREVNIDGVKTWIGISSQFSARDATHKDALEIVYADVKEFCDDKGATTVTTSQAQAQKSIPKEEAIASFDEDIGWKTFKTKEPCRDDEAGWAFIDNRNNPQGALKLREMLEGGVMRVRMRGTVFDVKMSEKFFNRNLPQAKVRRYQ
jgi:hypothetical protein